MVEEGERKTVTGRGGFKFYRRDSTVTFGVQLTCRRGTGAGQTQHSHPVDEAVTGTFAQGHDLKNVRVTPLAVVEESRWNKVRRSASITLARAQGKLG